MMNLYLALRFLKFTAVLAFSGGAIATFLSGDLGARKRAVHLVASPALAVAWATGYVLSSQLDVALTELWVLGGITLSTASLMALIYGVARDRRSAASVCAALLPLLATVAFMVFKPTWALFWSPR